MAGAIGAGGVGDLALTYGYERMNTPLMFLTVVILIILCRSSKPWATILPLNQEIMNREESS